MQLIKYLYATNFVTGANVMVIQLLGTRFLSPYFGGNLYVWTALITVTLVALSLGYFVGGYLADRLPQASVLYGLIFFAGAVLMAALLVRNTVLEFGAGVGSSFGPLGLGVGALVAAAVLFGLPLFILGNVAPFSVKLCAKEMDSLGHTVGRLYATSTAGSFVGTVTAGFFLIPSFSNVNTLAGCSAVLAILSCVYFVFFRKNPFPQSEPRPS